MNIKNLKRKLPFPIKQSVKYLYGLVPPRIHYGKQFWDTYNFLQESQWWPKEKLEDYQMQQLTKLLNHAYENVPYYRRIFDERGLKPKEIQNFNDLKKLPYLTKEIVQEHLTGLIARNYPKSRLEYVTTSGSTGIPLWFYYEKGLSGAKELPFIFTQWKRVGFKIGDRCVVLRGNVIQPASKSEFWEYDPINKNLILSSWHMKDEAFPKYIEKIREFKPDFIHSYPSAITVLAKFMRENNVESFPTVKAVLCASENLYSWQRELLEKVFQCRIYSHYGQTELVTLAGECEKSTYYHIFNEYGITELIKPDGTPANNEGEIGEIVGTGFNNYAMPFIRYKTGDFAVCSCKECSCGRRYRLIKRVEGRLQEFIVAKDNHLISLQDMQIYKIFDNVKQFQFHQDKKGEVVFNVIKKDTYTQKDTKHIKEELHKRFGSDMKIEIRFVNNILRTKSGKYRFLIQKLPSELRDGARNGRFEL